MYDFLLFRLSLVLLTTEYSHMSNLNEQPILSYNEQQVLNQKISSFLNVFFGGLQQNQQAFVLRTPIGMFPVTGESFDFDAHTYLVLEPEKQAGVEEITAVDDTVVFHTGDEILCIQKLKGAEHYYGFRMEPTRSVDSEWLSALQLLVTYAMIALKGRARNTLITYQNAGYKIIPVSPIVLEDKYNPMFKRAKLILA
jgi:hypothetical protein